MAGKNGRNGKGGRVNGGHGKRDEEAASFDDGIADPTSPGAPIPAFLEAAANGEDAEIVKMSAALESNQRMAEAGDRVADNLRELTIVMREALMDWRRSHEPIPLVPRAIIGNASRGAAIQLQTLADEVHPEGKRAAGGE